jgi:hypothetical protein
MDRSDRIASTGTLRPDIDDAFWTIVTGDDQWVRTEFDEIIAAGWDIPTPPPPPAPPQPKLPPSGPERRGGSRTWCRHPAPPRQPRHDQRAPPVRVG